MRFALWRYGLPLPARPGWRALVAEVVATGGAYVDPAGAIGAPVAWSLLDDHLQPIETRCAASGITIGPRSDPWGVRCARCGVPLACTQAGMRTSMDVPSCKPCRRIVKAAVRECG